MNTSDRKKCIVRVNKFMIGLSPLQVLSLLKEELDRWMNMIVEKN